MGDKRPNQLIEAHPVDREIDGFLIDCQARKLSPRTLTFYQDELGHLERHLRAVHVDCMENLTAPVLRAFLVELGKRRTPGGVAACLRAIKVFLNWFEREGVAGGWFNPAPLVKGPRLSTEPLPGVPMEHVRAMLATCRRDFLGLRDRAILITLVDSGLRKAEFAALVVGDLDLRNGSIVVRHGKGDKMRVVRIGATARQAINRYLRRHPSRQTPAAALWLSVKGTPLTAAGLRQVIRHRAALAGVPEPGVHDFRRTFALEFLRHNPNVYALMRLMGHTSAAVLQRYLRLVEDDLSQAHAAASPGDRL